MTYLIVQCHYLKEVLVKPSIPRFKIFPKYLPKMFTNSFSSEIALFSTKVILSPFKVFSVKEGFRVFLKKFIFVNVFYVEVTVKLFFGLSY